MHNNEQIYCPPFAMDELLPPVFPRRVVRLEYTAGDAALIRQAINECAGLGGGTVVVPKGRWYSDGPLVLKSNIRLVIEKDAVIEFSDRFSDYLPAVFTRWEGVECYNYSPLIYASGCENIAVEGEGLLIGSGAAWWPWKQLQGAAAKELYHAQQNQIPPRQRLYGTPKAALRPSFIQPVNCKNVLIKGLTILDGPQWTVHPVYCENVLIQGLTIKTHGPNTDGVNPDSCKNVVIEDCFFETGDDCIAINSGMNEDGWRVGKPCENILIRNNRMSDGHGAIVIGSGMSGGVKNVYAVNNTATGGMWGIRLKSMRGRGAYVENILIEQMQIHNTSRSAIQITMFYDTATAVPAGCTPPVLSGIHLKNITGTNNFGTLDFIGLPEHNIRDITLEHVSFAPEPEIMVQDVERFRIINESKTSLKQGQK